MIATLLLGSVTILMPEEARVRGTELTLGEVAEIRADDPGEVDRLKGLALGYAPAPGYSRVLYAERLQAELQSQFGNADLRVIGALATRVVPEVTIVDGAEIASAARAVVAKHVETAELDAKLELGNQIAALQVPTGDVPHRLEVVFPAADLRPGTLNVPVRVLVEDTLYRTVWTEWKLGVWALHPVPVRTIRAGEEIRREDLEVRRIAVAPGVSGSALEIAKLVGSAAGRDLAAGEPLAAGDVIRPFVIERDDSIFIDVKKGAIHVRTAAIAKQRGAIGDRIMVEIADNQRQMKATVVARDLVELRLETNRKVQ